jgi:poly-gamma-glutamate system protein
MYWRPAGASRRALLALAVLAVGALLTAEFFPRDGARDEALKFEAAQRAQEAFDVIRRERLRRGPPLDPDADPAGTGLIGVQESPVTSSPGSLAAKQTSANPNFAAVVVECLLTLQVREGDVVAAGFSGSFPALNIAVLSAARTLNVELIAITSAAASNWGANVPELLWLDMERALAREGLFNQVSLAASLGGLEDAAGGLSPAGRLLLVRGIERNEMPQVPEHTFTEAIAHRMELYDRAARGRPIAAYVNVGGGAVSVGRQRGKVTYRAGINRPAGKAPVDSVIGRFLDRGVPVVHLVRVERLADEYGLPRAPREAQRPGEGGLFRKKRPNETLVAGLLVGLCGTIVFVGRRSRARARLTAGEPPPSSQV